MKITRNTDLAAILSSKALNPSPDSDLLQKAASRKPPRRKTRNSSVGAGVRLKRDGAPSGKRSRPETPLLRWKFDDREKDVDFKDEKSLPEVSGKSGRKVRRGKEIVVPARKARRRTLAIAVARVRGQWQRKALSAKERSVRVSA
ncbi:hypothetical protein F0562_010104 [Nyssa sinensis]|uniref:Uncharacterized protein n=1 Tax=Nyssa sinensis TaxID=561372 RepID=A0A5J5A2N4_9ASTE|nr:hypothetical protein F0562_010104 [Nyssa sinensis]